MSATLPPNPYFTGIVFNRALFTQPTVSQAITNLLAGNNTWTGTNTFNSNALLSSANTWTANNIFSNGAAASASGQKTIQLSANHVGGTVGSGAKLEYINLGTTTVMASVSSVVESGSNVGLVFSTLGSDILTAKAVLTSIGRLGIGQLSPQHLLDVDGGINGTLYYHEGIRAGVIKAFTSFKVISTIVVSIRTTNITVTRSSIGLFILTFGSGYSAIDNTYLVTGNVSDTANNGFMTCTQKTTTTCTLETRTGGGALFDADRWVDVLVTFR